jgi:hypothetical protein
MSVLVAVVSGIDGVVACDGRRSSSAFLADGKVEKPSTVASDEFDKTFALDGGKIIGAFCGLLEFSGRTVGQHIVEIVGPVLPPGSRFESIVEQITQGIARRLGEADEAEVVHSARTVDLILVGGERLTKSELRIASVRFGPQGITPLKHSKFCRAGDDAAASVAGDLLQKRYVGNRGAAFLERLATAAIEAGIRASGQCRYGTHIACGGRVFQRRTWYP